MKTENIIQDKSFDFAKLIVFQMKKIIDEKKEYVLTKQLLKSGTSIGANVEEAIGAQSQNDFIAKLSIANKESRESKYWLKLLLATDYLSEEEFVNSSKLLDEIIRILAKILITTKNKKLNVNS